MDRDEQIRGWSWARLRRLGTPEQLQYDDDGLAGLEKWGFNGPVFIVSFAPRVVCDGCNKTGLGLVPVADVTSYANDGGWSVELLCYHCLKRDGGLDPARIEAGAVCC